MNDYPAGTTPAQHDQLADDYAEEARAAFALAERLRKKSDSHRAMAANLLEDYHRLRAHQEAIP